MNRCHTVCAVVLALVLGWAGTISAAELELEVGFDGSNPQSADRVIREAPARWRVRPFNEQGSNDHYWFRFNARLVNNSDQDRDAELLIEWPVLERYPDFPYDYYFYGRKGSWRPLYGSIDGTVAKLIVPCEPGTTYVGFYPRYSFAQHMEFIESAQEGAVDVRLEGKSFQGREIHSLRMGAPGKPKVLITARNHPYETSCSFIVEEMVDWLRSGDPRAAELLAGHEIFFLPMMNPDGVATGCNQRTRPDGGVNMSYGADSDDPSVTALLGMVRRVQPAIWADIHSWPHEGDDGMWCTHQWVADKLLEQMPDSTFGEYVWNVSFVRERSDMDDNHLWKWLIRTFDSGGVSLSISWYRRTEDDMGHIGRRILEALCAAAEQAP